MSKSQECKDAHRLIGKKLIKLGWFKAMVRVYGHTN